MANNDLFKKVKELRLPAGEYALFGSAPMGIRGLKECGDADIIVNEDIWQEYKNKPGWRYQLTENGVEHIESDDRSIELWHNWLPWHQEVTAFIDEAEIIDGLPFVRLERVLEWKRSFGREKDLKDIKVIEAFLGSQKR